MRHRFKRMIKRLLSDLLFAIGDYCLSLSEQIVGTDTDPFMWEKAFFPTGATGGDDEKGPPRR